MFSRQVPEELIVIDLHPKNVSAGTKCQKQMAEMLTMVGGDEERQLGFRPAERQYTAKAWDHSIRFAENAEVERTQSSLLNYAMLLIGESRDHLLGIWVALAFRECQQSSM